MKRTMRLIAVILAVIVMVSALPLTVIAEDYGIAPMSLLPLDYFSGNVTIDRREEIPPELLEESPFTFYTYEALSEILYQKSIITAPDAEYSGKIFYSLEENGSFSEVGWRDVITTESSYDYVYFLLSDGDQLNPNNVRIRMYVRFSDDSIQNYLDANILSVYNDGETVYAPQRYWSSTYTTTAEGRKTYYYLYAYASNLNVSSDAEPTFLLSFPEDYPATKVTVYSGRYYTKEELEANGAEDITAIAVSGGENATPISLSKVNGYYSSEYSTWTSDITLVIEAKNGRTFVVPTIVRFGTTTNSISYSISSNTYDWQYLYLYDENGNYYSQRAVADQNSIAQMSLNIYNARYYDLVDQTLADYRNGDINKVLAVYVGSYSSMEEAKAAGAEDVRASLFSGSGCDILLSAGEEYRTLYTAGGAKVSLREIVLTAFDSYGYVISFVNYTFGVLLDEINEPIEPEYTSTATYLYVNGAYKEAKTEGTYPYSYDSWVMPADFDSYYRNGYQTIFILDDDNPVNAEYIYPTFNSYYDSRIYLGKDAVDESDGKTPLQTSGESGIKFESGVPVQYSAASESGTHLKNYWVTFITPQKGPKLFVNGTNYEGHYNEETGNPVREIFFNSQYGYSHDILIANIGDEPLTNLKVTLSDDAQGVVLDDYWTIVEDGVRTLGAFDSVYDGNRDNGYTTEYLGNIAKIRLNPVDDNLSAISGTLTISADNIEPVVIELTGIAGTPKITSTDIYDGVKYVPYSCVIETNSMYEANALKFSIINGELPKGVELLPNGELYGVPLEAGEFKFTVTATFNSNTAFTFNNSTVTQLNPVTFTLTVKDNTDENVDAVNYDIQGYELLDRVSREVTVVYSSLNADNTPVIEEIIIDSDLFRSEGAYGEYLYFYIDGILLEDGVDFISEEGSTKITILDQTFGHVALSDGNIAHTLAAEFRTDGDDLMRSAQNIYIKYQKKEINNPSNPSNPSDPTNPNYPTYPNPGYNSSYYNTVTCVIKLVDADGSPVSGLFLELHSTPQYAVTGNDGSALFLGIEFGRHTLYVTDANGNALAKKAFSIVSGDDGGISGDIITAQIGETVEITVCYNGGNLLLLGAETVVEVPEEGTTTDEDEEDVDAIIEAVDKEETYANEDTYVDDSNPGTGIVLAFHTLLSAIIVTAAAKKKQW